MLTVKQLRMLVNVVCADGDMEKVSADLNVSENTVWGMVHSIEKELGVAIMAKRRVNHEGGRTLTPIALEVAAIAKDVLADVEEIYLIAQTFCTEEAKKNMASSTELLDKLKKETTTRRTSSAKNQQLEQAP